MIDYLLKIININLGYYVNRYYNEFESVDRLSKLLTFKDNRELKEFTEKEKMLKKYYNKMDRLCKDEEHLKMVWDERIEENVRMEESYQAGVYHGIQEGIIKNKTEMILSMHDDKLSDQIIAKYANITIDEVENIIANNL